MGSSPLTRGKRRSSCCRRGRGGLIPTHAGKTRGMCVIADSVRGSSPLTRGKLNSADHFGIALGLIPTHAGKTLSQSFCAGTCRAHPHSRGENNVIAGNSSEPPGSSPLTRGKPHAETLYVGEDGLIPTHAGKTYLILLRTIPRRAHPHSRGENEAKQLLEMLSQGSSPLTRGKPRRASPTASCTGLIPTHAGKTVGVLQVGTYE